MKTDKNLSTSSSLLSKKKSESRSFWESIRKLPIYNWDKVHETGDLRYLLKVWDEDYVPTKEDTKRWFNLKDEKFREFGHSPVFEQWFRLQKKLAKAQLKLLSTGKMSHINRIRLYEAEIARFESANKGYSTSDIIAKLQQKMPIMLNMQTLPTWDYYNYLKNITLPSG